MTGCMPDSFTKWDKPEEKVTATSGVNVTGPNGETTNVPPPSGGTAPTSFSYTVSEVNLKLNQDMTALTPTFVGQVGTTNTYIFTAHEGDNCPSIPVATTLASLGLSLNSSTGVISGKPTVFPTIGSNSYSIRAYHVESGVYLCNGTAIDFNFGTDFSASSFKIIYPQQSGTKLILKVSSVAAFTTEPSANFAIGDCTSTTNSSYCISNSSGAFGEIYHINAANNELIVGVGSDGEVFSIGDSIDNSSSFVAEETKITDLTYSIDTDSANIDSLFDTDGRLVADFTSSVSDEEKALLNWSISPDIDSVTSSSLSFTANTTNGPAPFGGTLTGAATFQSFDATTFTVTAANLIGQTKQTTIKISASEAPDSLAYAQWKLIQLDPDNSYFSPGDAISTNNGGSGIVKRLVGTDKILLESRGGDFKVDDKVDAVTPYLAERATVIESEVVSSVISMPDVGLAVDDRIGQELGTTDAIGLVKFIDESTQILALDTSIANIRYREYVSPGTIIEGEDSGAIALVNYIDFTNHNLYVNILSGTFESNEYVLVGSARRLKLTSAALNAVGANYFDHYVLTVSSTGFVDDKSEDVVRVLSNTPLVADGGTSLGVIDHLTSQNVRIHPTDANTRDDNYLSTSNSFPRKGFDIATKGGAAGIITNAPTSPASYWDVLVESGAFRSQVAGGDAIDIKNPFSLVADIDTISKTEELLKFTVNRGQSINLVPQVTQGDNLLFAIASDSPTAILPLGLSLDSNTGIISGTPTDPTTGTFKITATNAIGTISFTFQLEVIDSFTLVNITSNADSYHMHKAGKGRQYSNCSINSYQMSVSQYNEPKDITCYLEAGELDLYFNGLKLGVDVGPGLCNFVQMKPFSFYQYEYQRTGADTEVIYYKYTKAASCTGNCTDIKNGGTPACTTLVDDTIPTTPCTGDYSGSGGPNCDDGYYTIRTVALTDTASPADGNCFSADGDVTITDADTECTGSRASCIAGPVKDLLNDAQIDLFMNSMIYNSADGKTNSNLNWTFSSPISKGFVTNRSISNSFTSHACYGTGSNGWDYERVSDWEMLSSGTYYAVPMTATGSFQTGDYFSNTADTFKGSVYSIENNFITTRAISGDSTVLSNGLTMNDQYGIIPTAASVGTINTNGGVYNIHLTYPHAFAGEELYYTVNCLDAAYDIKARIRLVVREWNKNFNLSDGIDFARSTNHTMGLSTLGNFAVGDFVTNDSVVASNLARFGGVVDEVDTDNVSIAAIVSSSSYLLDVSPATGWTYNPAVNVTSSSGFIGDVTGGNTNANSTSLLVQVSTGFLRIGETINHNGFGATVLSFTKINSEHLSVGDGVADAISYDALEAAVTSISPTDLMNITSNDSFGNSYNNRRDWDDGANNIGNTKPEFLFCPAGRGPITDASGTLISFPGSGL